MSPPASEQETEDRPQILVVDDDEMVREVVVESIKADGLNVVVCGDGAEALEIARETVYDLIVTDMRLPGMDGLKITRRIKSDDQLKDIPIVAISGAAMQEDKEEAIAAGCVGYISKPIDVHSFVETIEKLIA